MLDISKVSKNLIAVSAISSLLVIWLGSRFLSDAYIQYSGAAQLQRSVLPEQTLFNLARSIDRERSSIQKLIVSTSLSGDEFENLDEITENSNALLDEAVEQVNSSKLTQSSKTDHLYSDTSIHNSITDLQDKFERISHSSSIIYVQSSLPPASRDEGMRMQLFDAYTNLAQDTNNLRTRIQYLPVNNFQGVVSAHSLKNAIWEFNEAINQTSILLESYLIKAESKAVSNINLENLSLRLLQQHERAEQSLSELTEILISNDANGIGIGKLDKVKSLYNGDFRNHVKALLSSFYSIADPDISSSQWRDISAELKAQVNLLSGAAISNTLDALLVLLCIGMAIAAFSVAKKVQHQADHDELTNIPNRRRFLGAVQSGFRKADLTADEKLILVTMDLNRFKIVNDTMGHAIGDKLLVAVANRLNSIVDHRMFLARMGGDEFAIFYSTNDPSEPYSFAKKINSLFVEPFSVDDALINMEASIGYSCYPDDASTPEELQTTSDFAMFNAKQNRSSNIQPYDRELASQFENRIVIENDLVTAIENDQLELYYQPQFNISKNIVDGVEALIRWNHPLRGMVSPVEFVEIAEDSGLMPAMGNWVLNEACRQAASWQEETELKVRVAVNVSVHQVMQSNFVQNVLDTLEHHNLSAHCIELEVTESVVVADVNWVVKCLTELKENGIKIALDDFGTGYSSLSQLQLLPLHTLKIDRSFISKLDDNKDSTRSVTSTITSIADIYGLETVAEGVETESQLREISRLGINIAQGYFYSKPMNSIDVVDQIFSINSQASELRKSA